jgi:ATP-dependent Clp protease adaptor protein ClpS
MRGAPLVRAGLVVAREARALPRGNPSCERDRPRLNEKACMVTFCMGRIRRHEDVERASTYPGRVEARPCDYSTLDRRIDAPRSALEAPTIEKEEATSEEIEMPWNVIVHNDPVNLMSYVTMVFQRVFGYPRDKAEKHMLEVHHNGRSILWSGLRERAELYVQQLHGYLLLATIEKIG